VEEWYSAHFCISTLSGG